MPAIAITSRVEADRAVAVGVFGRPEQHQGSGDLQPPPDARHCRFCLTNLDQRASRNRVISAGLRLGSVTVQAQRLGRRGGAEASRGVRPEAGRLGPTPPAEP
jgi:hypothetical protein